MRKPLIFLVILSLSTKSLTVKSEEEEDTETDDQPPRGKSFFLFGGIFHRFRRRWLGYREPLDGPLFAGPAFPISGYYNCPIYGCNSAVAYQPAPFEPPNIYNYPIPPPNPYALTPQQQFLQQQQQQYQQNNLHIYQHGQQGNGYYGNTLSPKPLYPYRGPSGLLPVGFPYPVQGYNPPSPPAFLPPVNPAYNAALSLGQPSLPLHPPPGPPMTPPSVPGSCNSQETPCGQ